MSGPEGEKRRGGDVTPLWTPPPGPPGAPERRVGVELEMFGPSAAAAAGIVSGLLGGVPVEQSKHRAAVETPDYGPFIAELDLRAAHRAPGAPPLLSEELDVWLREVLGDIGSAVAPMEIICPPIPISRAHVVDALVERLRESGASGVGGSIFFAVGAQLNPELLDRSPETIIAYLRAFVLLREWLREEIALTPSRRLLPFADPYPLDYQRLLMASEYAPDMESLIEDYLDFNPTRNRELDLLPLLRFIDEERVVAALPEETINARPTFHYRLPNMALETPGWRIGLEWERWRRVELLAAQRPLLPSLMAEWRHADEGLVSGWRAGSRCIAAMLAHPGFEDDARRAGQ